MERTAELRAAYAMGVAVAEHPQEPGHLTVVAPKEALRRAQPLPSDEDMAVEGLTSKLERVLARLVVVQPVTPSAPVVVDTMVVSADQPRGPSGRADAQPPAISECLLEGVPLVVSDR